MNPRAHRQKIRALAAGSPIIVTAYDAMQMSGDMAAPFLQEASFLWLTGINLPGWKMIFDTSRDHAVLVRPTRSDIEKTFDGDVSDADICHLADAQEVIDERDLERHLRTLARHHTLVYTLYDKTPHEFVANPAQKTLCETLERIFARVERLDTQLHEARAIKTEAEIQAIKSAVALTVNAFTEVRANLASYKHEYELEAAFTHIFRARNATHAYEPIVASGDHAVTLHYVRNDGPLRAREAVLIDIGARVHGYAADITRTYALNPTKRQRAVHAAVEAAHGRIIELLGPDVLVSDYIRTVDEIMKDALQELELLPDRQDTDTYRRYFPHAVGHGLGIDVHDSLGAPRYFKPGMVVTVEPGIYIPEEGIGVRIEDDILITAQGRESLSKKLPTSL